LRDHARAVLEQLPRGGALADALLLERSQVVCVGAVVVQQFLAQLRQHLE
jgi:hypothetical protein